MILNFLNQSFSELKINLYSKTNKQTNKTSRKRQAGKKNAVEKRRKYIIKVLQFFASFSINRKFMENLCKMKYTFILCISKYFYQ